MIIQGGLGSNELDSGLGGGMISDEVVWAWMLGRKTLMIHVSTAATLSSSAVEVKRVWKSLESLRDRGGGTWLDPMMSGEVEEGPTGYTQFTGGRKYRRDTGRGEITIKDDHFRSGLSNTLPDLVHQLLHLS